MAKDQPAYPELPSSAEGKPSAVRLEVRTANGQAISHEVSPGGFLIGSVPGCDLRLPGTNLPPVLCLIAPVSGGALLRKLIATQPILVNGQTSGGCTLQDGDRIAITATELTVHVEEQRSGANTPPGPRTPDALTGREADLQARETRLTARQQELGALQAELSKLREQLYTQFRERRDRLLRMRDGLRKAGRKLLEHKRHLEHRATAQVPFGLERSHLAEEKLTRDREDLEKALAQYQSDLVRLDRRQAVLEEQQKQVRTRARDVDLAFEEMQRTGRQLEEEATRLDLEKEQLRSDRERLERNATAGAAVQGQLQERAAALEQQQAVLAVLRTRLERERETAVEIQQRAAEQQARLDERERELEGLLREARETRNALLGERSLLEHEQKSLAEREAACASTARQVREIEQGFAGRERELTERGAELEGLARDLAVQQEENRQETQRFKELRERLTAERDLLQERESRLSQSEHVREALQEQLHRRAQELETRQRVLAESEAKLTESQRLLEEETQRQRAEHSGHVQDLRSQAESLGRARNDLLEQETRITRQSEQFRQMGRKLAQAKKSQALVQARLRSEQDALESTTAERKAALERLGSEVRILLAELPEAELRTAAALDRLEAARAQLREHLSELNGYARQSEEDLTAMRRQLEEEAQEIAQGRLVLHRARDEHRLAVAAFRQQLVEWQGQVTEMKRTLARDETRLERRQAQVDEQARQIDRTSLRLAQQAEELEHQERAVAQDRNDMERHLADMREWYRRKLRELSQRRAGREPLQLVTGADRPPDDLDVPDRKLGELLQSLGLVEAGTLADLLAEARRYRRTLRQALLAGGYLTLYQMALIETGNMGGLVLGPYRVIDRLRVTPHESVYRVYDPNLGREARLRHLSEMEMEDSSHPAEFRARFGKAAGMSHPNLQTVFEVTQIDGRPAVLEDGPEGVSGNDLSAYVAQAEVWLCLVHQAAVGLQAAHQAGLVHGHLRAGSFVLLADGTLKLCGLGEPAWLVATARANAADPPGDLRDLGRSVALWATGWPVQEPVQSIRQRLAGEPANDSLDSLLADVNAALEALPAWEERWRAFLQVLGEQVEAEPPLKKSA
jgi:hypothetical protein